MKRDRTRPSTGRIDRDRRSLCQAGGLLIAAAALPACGGGQGGGSCGAGAYDTGLEPSSLKMSSAQPFIMTNRAVFVCRDAGGVYALDANCTHRGCFVNFIVDTPSFSCPCHGASFDFNGDNPTSPAPTPMPHYEVCVSDNGTLVVDVSKVVSATVRYSL
jgi:nitrite reductase/ring-hydroxylating ferredoxin subunit